MNDRPPDREPRPDSAQLSRVGAPVAPDSLAGLHRRRAAHLYGLIISGAVLTAASHTHARISTVAIALVGTLVIYWAAETYVHLMAARMVHQRDLTWAERREVLDDGFPLVAACGLPLVVLVVETAIGIPADTAVRIALLTIAVLLFVVGWNMARAGGLGGWRRVVVASVTGSLGLVMILLKTLLH